MGTTLGILMFTAMAALTVIVPMMARSEAKDSTRIRFSLFLMFVSLSMHMFVLGVVVSSVI